MTIKELRKQKNLTLKQFGESINMSISAICKYERGAYKKQDKIIDKIFEVYGVRVDKSYNAAMQLQIQNDNLKKENQELKKQIKLMKLTKHSIERIRRFLDKIEEEIK